MKRVLKEFLAPGLVALVTVTAAWVRMEMVAQEHEREIQELRDQIHSISNCGPNGFLSPSTHSAHDLHMQHWHEDVFGRTGWRRLLTEYSTNGNPR